MALTVFFLLLSEGQVLECFDGLIDERKSRQEIGFLIGCVLEGFLVSFGTIRHHLPSFFNHLLTYAC